MTRTKRTRRFRRRNDSRPGYAMPKALPSTPPASVFVTQHGRDQLHANWPDLYKPRRKRRLPAEELLLLKQGGDYGWPECYYDPGSTSWCLRRNTAATAASRWVFARTRLAPVAAFPAHWGPNGMVLLRQETISGPLSQWRVHRLSRFVGSCALSARWLQRRLSAARRRPCIRGLRNLRRRFRGSGQVSGERRASSLGSGCRARRIALCFRR